MVNKVSRSPRKMGHRMLKFKNSIFQPKMTQSDNFHLQMQEKALNTIRYGQNNMFSSLSIFLTSGLQIKTTMVQFVYFSYYIRFLRGNFDRFGKQTDDLFKIIKLLINQ